MLIIGLLGPSVQVPHQKISPLKGQSALPLPVANFKGGRRTYLPVANFKGGRRT
jgi:hypothetical protein